MKTALLRAVIAATASLTLLLASSGAWAAPPIRPHLVAHAQRDGEAIYHHICQGCHMANGQGATGAGTYPRLAGDPALASWRYVALIVLNGRSDMPVFGIPKGEAVPPRSAQLTDAQIAAVIDYLRSHFGNHYGSRVTPGQVAALPHPNVVAHP